MASILKVDEMQGVTSAGDITITSEGGSATMQLQRGMAKVWAHITASGASLSDSLNVSSLDDDGTGEYGLNYTNNMEANNYSVVCSITFSHTSGANNHRIVACESLAASAAEIDSGYVDLNGVWTSYDIESNAGVSVNGDLA
tara:strand:- start:354 stop:779 length:426 start_codon:yes stop_codon:yes gene_type:complete